MISAAYMTTILKLASVLLVVYCSLRGERRGMGRSAPLIALVAASSVLHLLGHGASGLALMAAGMCTGCVLALGLYRTGDIGRREILLSVTAGGLAGPAGALSIFIVVYMLVLLERALHADRTRIRERFAGYLIETGLLDTGNAGSAGMETGTGCGHGPGAGEEGPAGAEEGFSLVNPTFPLKAKIALATLVVIFSGSVF